MRYLFSALGHRMVNDIIGRKVLYAFGLDGMLSKGVEDPQTGALPPELHRALMELGKRTHGHRVGADACGFDRPDERRRSLFDRPSWA
jgi:hypothetical protein